MKVNDYFDKVVVINLDRRIDRMAKLAPQLEALGITYERHSAVDGFARNISPIIAGTMSHVEVMKKYSGQKVLILEDDALFVDDFNEKFTEVIQDLPKDWDVLYLGALVPKETGEVTQVSNHWWRQVFTTGTHAYCIRPEMMDYFISKLDGFEWFIDVGLREFAQQYRPYIVQPNLVIQFPSFSDLRNKEVNDF
jgi:GR25 family glycosyltransferase involved in LPS biosynthesis